MEAAFWFRDWGLFALEASNFVNTYVQKFFKNYPKAITDKQKKVERTSQPLKGQKKTMT